LFDLNGFLHMGWLYPKSPAAEVICPDLVAQAAAQGWEAERYIGLAIARVPAWIRSKVAVRKDVLDTITQNFVLRMMERRPDLFHDPQKNTMEAFLVGLLRVIERESWRQELPCRVPEDAPDAERSGSSPDRQMEHDEDVAIVAGLLDQLPADQRDAVKEKYFGPTFVGSRGSLPSRIIHVRRSRGLSAMRTAAERLGMGSVSLSSARRRMPRGVRRLRGRALSRRSRNGSTPEAGTATVTSVLAPAVMSEREKAIRASNARALQRLLSSLPSPLNESGEVLSQVIEVFEQRFARRLTRSRRDAEAA
jgi:hypothetical protein